MQVSAILHYQARIKGTREPHNEAGWGIGGRSRSTSSSSSSSCPSESSDPSVSYSTSISPSASDLASESEAAPDDPRLKLGVGEIVEVDGISAVLESRAAFDVAGGSSGDDDVVDGNTSVGRDAFTGDCMVENRCSGSDREEPVVFDARSKDS